jgi:hypothetical protein
MEQIDTPTTELNTSLLVPWLPEYDVGIGIDAITGQIRASGIVPPVLVEDPVLQQSYNSVLIKNATDLSSTIQGSLSASYNIQGATISGSTAYLRQIAVSELSVSLVVSSVIQETGSTKAASYALKPGANPIDGKFRDKYGDFFIAGYRRMASIFIIYKCSFRTAEQRDKFTSSLSVEIPRLTTVKGSTEFEKIAKSADASISIRIISYGHTGLQPTEPAGGWTPEAIPTVLMPWFNDHYKLVPQTAILRHYTLIDPLVPTNVPVAPEIFSILGVLYLRLWTLRSSFENCPEFGRPSVQRQYEVVTKEIEGYQENLPNEPDRIRRLTNEVDDLLNAIYGIQARQSLYSQVIVAMATEPAKGKAFESNTGTVWTYGISDWSNGISSQGVVINAVSDSVARGVKTNGGRHTFEFMDPTRIIVGFAVISDRKDGLNGSWRITSNGVLGKKTASIKVEGKASRAYSWSVIWYTVEAGQYPQGPWAAETMFAPTVIHLADSESSEPLSYWTPERMCRAEPYTPPVPQDGVEAPTETAPASTGTAGIRLAEYHSAPMDPVSTKIGRLFWTDPDGKDQWGSAFVVDEQGIMSAAHCLIEAGLGRNAVFAPGYSQSGPAVTLPLGLWIVYGKVTPAGYDPGDQDATYDYGFAKARPAVSGTSGNLGHLVGGPIALQIDRPGVHAWTAMGYPRNLDGGVVPWQCLGTRREFPDHALRVSMHGNFKQGASGGPWLVDDGHGAPQANGLTARSGNWQAFMTSPYFDKHVLELFDSCFGRLTATDADDTA